MDGPSREFAIRLGSIDQLFWQFDSQPVAERSVTGDVRWYLLDEWERVRQTEPSHLTIYAPASERDGTDEDAVRKAIHGTLRSASGPLRRVDPLSRQEKVAAWIGVAVLLLTVGIATALEHVSDAVVVESISQAITVVGWVAVWRPAERFVVEVVPHVFNRRRFAEFADIDVRFVWI
ncbi:MAG TPA: hypothetical protein VHF45_00075 [Thermoleophilaceae bacterium]|nr:hypothetical protein [Thermoleophilaceae bacterium]